MHITTIIILILINTNINSSSLPHHRREIAHQHRDVVVALVVVLVVHQLPNITATATTLITLTLVKMAPTRSHTSAHRPLSV